MTSAAACSTRSTVDSTEILLSVVATWPLRTARSAQCSRMLLSAIARLLGARTAFGIGGERGAHLERRRRQVRDDPDQPDAGLLRLAEQAQQRAPPLARAHVVR